MLSLLATFAFTSDEEFSVVFFFFFADTKENKLFMLICVWFVPAVLPYLYEIMLFRPWANLNVRWNIPLSHILTGLLLLVLECMTRRICIFCVFTQVMKLCT